MDRQTVYPDQIPFDTDILGIERFVYEALGLALYDICGATTQVAGLPCVPTTPASLNVKVGAGRIYMINSLEATAWGGFGGVGGLALDTNADHNIMKQGLHRDTETFSMPVPVTVGQSINYLIQAQFQEADDAGVTSEFFNTDNVTAPIAHTVSPVRRDKCVLSLKAGAAAASGTQSTPTADAGWVPVWQVVVAHADTQILAGAISPAPAAPFLVLAGGAAGVTLWQNVNANYTALAGDKLIADTSGGAFTITLPAAPVADSSVVRIKVNGATNNLTVARNGHNFAGFAGDLVINADFVDVTITYDGATWRI